MAQYRDSRILLQVPAKDDDRKEAVSLRQSAELFPETDRRIYAMISAHDGIKAREIASALGEDRTAINRLLVSSALMREMCYQDRDYRWHALIRQQVPHEGLYEFSGWYGLVSEFLSLSEDDWLSQLCDGCRRIGRNLNDTRGLIHSFRDCGETVRLLFSDLAQLSDLSFEPWELAFEFRLNRARMIRIYADVMIIAPGRVFVLEFKMKNKIDPEEVLQAAKYVPYLELIFGQTHEILPALVLTGSSDLFELVPIGKTDALLPVCSGNMLFNVLNEYMGFLD